MVALSTQTRRFTSLNEIAAPLGRYPLPLLVHCFLHCTLPELSTPCVSKSFLLPFASQHICLVPHVLLSARPYATVRIRLGRMSVPLRYAPLRIRLVLCHCLSCSNPIRQTQLQMPVAIGTYVHCTVVSPCPVIWYRSSAADILIYFEQRVFPKKTHSSFSHALLKRSLPN